MKLTTPDVTEYLQATIIALKRSMVHLVMASIQCDRSIRILAIDDQTIGSFYRDTHSVRTKNQQFG